MRSAIYSLLKDDGILVIPTIADPPPKLGGKEILSEDYKRRACSLLSIASISGCCQVTIPLGFHNKCPVSVSFIARNGGDRFLLDTTQAMYATLQEQADIAAKSKGNQAFKDKQWQKAIGFYTEAIKLSGKNATYYSNRALAYLELGSSAAEHREGWLLNWQLKMHNLTLITISVVSYDEKKFIPSSFIKVIGRVEVGTELDNQFDS
ncbi:translocon at the outer membrane of chloroplasts 64 [Quercus suber]|uniref:Translocon at the outer membrane of chloroplasts 64 n=1 Tax=Quercus suber TaxID=58331 RepID=A0AAW0M2J4_QUESU